jgi:hypothetical protein
MYDDANIAVTHLINIEKLLILLGWMRSEDATRGALGTVFFSPPWDLQSTNMTTEQAVEYLLVIQLIMLESCYSFLVN